jgi:hypothetical protein
MPGVAVGILVALAVTYPVHERCHRVAQVEGHRLVAALLDLLADDNRYLHRELLRLSGDEIIGADFGLKGVMEMAIYKIKRRKGFVYRVRLRMDGHRLSRSDKAH